MKNNNQHHKNSLLPSKVPTLKFLLSQPPIKKIITEVLLILHLYLIWFFIWWRFRYLIKAMADVESLAGTADTPKEGIEQHKKREYLKSNISKGKILGGKNNGHMKETSDETISKTYAEYKQRELNEKSEKTRNALGKHFIKLYSTGISQVVKIRDVKKL